MNIQEAYNKGLTDAENNVIQILRQALIQEEHQPFANPELNKILDVIKTRSDYYRSFAKRANNIGISFRKRLKNEHEILGVEGNIPHWKD